MSKRVVHIRWRIAAVGAYLPPGLPVVGLGLLLHSSRFVRFHALQSLLLAAVGFVGFVVLSYLRALGWALLPFWVLLMFVWWLVGMVNGGKGKRYILPLVGKYADRLVSE